MHKEQESEILLYFLSLYLYHHKDQLALLISSKYTKHVWLQYFRSLELVRHKHQLLNCRFIYNKWDIKAYSDKAFLNHQSDQYLQKPQKRKKKKKTKASFVS